jgi:circadian clock protein KaiC
VFASLFETPAELLLRSRHMGLGIEGAVNSGQVRLLHSSFADLEPDSLAWELWEEAESIGARRVVIDGISALEQVIGAERLPGYLWAVLAHLRARGATVCVTMDVADPRMPYGDLPMSVAGIMDNVINLRVAEEDGHLRYRLAVTKMRDSDHDRMVHYYVIGDNGLQILAQ